MALAIGIFLVGYFLCLSLYQKYKIILLNKSIDVYEELVVSMEANDKEMWRMISTLSNQRIQSMRDVNKVISEAEANIKKGGKK